MKIGIEFKPEDLYIGIFWKKTNNINRGLTEEHDNTNNKKKIDIWICLMPCFPLHISLN